MRFDRWNEDDILRLVKNKIREGIEIEYKRSNSLESSPKRIAEISKDVSAFANSAGGRLYYGVVDDKNIPVDRPGVRSPRPQSDRAPHMANDRRYCKRFNFQSVSMEEYEVRDVMRRQETPDLRIEIQEEHLVAQGKYMKIQFHLTNHAPEPAHHATIFVYIDQRLATPGLEGMVFETGGKTGV
jgi:predicted HTH transcriptional regulator